MNPGTVAPDAPPLIRWNAWKGVGDLPLAGWIHPWLSGLLRLRAVGVPVGDSPEDHPVESEIQRVSGRKDDAIVSLPSAGQVIEGPMKEAAFLPDSGSARIPGGLADRKQFHRSIRCGRIPCRPGGWPGG